MRVIRRYVWYASECHLPNALISYMVTVVPVWKLCPAKSAGLRPGRIERVRLGAGEVNVDTVWGKD